MYTETRYDDQHGRSTETMESTRHISSAGQTKTRCTIGISDANTTDSPKWLVTKAVKGRRTIGVGEAISADGTCDRTTVANGTNNRRLDYRSRECDEQN